MSTKAVILFKALVTLSLLLNERNSVTSLDNGLALTPPMGWMSWQRFRCLIDCKNYPDECISDKLVRRIADRMSSDGYLEAGYKYLIIDDCWLARERDGEGRLQPDPERFPNGIKPLANYVHGKGLKFGIYEDYGTLTCGGYPGILGHLEVDAKTFAEWEVDYLKLDGCYVDEDGMEEGYAEMGRYLNETGRPIVYSCSFPAYKGLEANYTAAVEHCNLWRNYGDIQDSYSSYRDIANWFRKNQDFLNRFSGPGHWNDPDMLLIGNFGLSYEQSKAQMAIWAILAAPLLMSVDLGTIEPKFKEILLNGDAVAVNQDLLGRPGILQSTVDDIEVWIRSILPHVDDEFTSAIAFVSRRDDGYPYRLVVKLEDLGLSKGVNRTYTIRDVFEPSGSVNYIGSQDPLEIRVKPSGTVFIVATPLPLTDKDNYLR